MNIALHPLKFVSMCLAYMDGGGGCVVLLQIFAGIGIGGTVANDGVKGSFRGSCAVSG